jgi:hypothetical protein
MAKSRSRTAAAVRSTVPSLVAKSTKLSRSGTAVFQGTCGPVLPEPIADRSAIAASREEFAADSPSGSFVDSMDEVPGPCRGGGPPLSPGGHSYHRLVGQGNPIRQPPVAMERDGIGLLRMRPAATTATDEPCPAREDHP